MQLDKYISDIKNGIDTLGKWPTKMLTERSIEVNYTEENIRLSGRIIVAFSVPNGHVNVRVSFYNYNGVRKESIVMRELSVEAVVKQVESFISAKRSPPIRFPGSWWRTLCLVRCTSCGFSSRLL